MHIRDFDFQRLPRGVKQSLWLDITACNDGGNWRLPLLSVTGEGEGPDLAGHCRCAWR